MKLALTATALLLATASPADAVNLKIRRWSSLGCEGKDGAIYKGKQPWEMRNHDVYTNNPKKGVEFVRMRDGECQTFHWDKPLFKSFALIPNKRKDRRLLERDYCRASVFSDKSCGVLIYTTDDLAGLISSCQNTTMGGRSLYVECWDRSDVVKLAVPTVKAQGSAEDDGLSTDKEEVVGEEDAATRSELSTAEGDAAGEGNEASEGEGDSVLL